MNGSKSRFAPRETETVRTSLSGGVLWVTLNRPNAANARNQQMRHELAETWRSVASANDVVVAVLSGGDGRHFCAGMDLKEASRNESPVFRRERMGHDRDIELLAALPRPTIASINGTALGGGLEMALACDIRVVSEEALLGLPEVTHGLLPGGGGTHRLPRIVGLERALEMMYLGTTVSGDEAVRLGLASRSVPRENLSETVASLAASIAEKQPRALNAIKQSALFGLDHPTNLSSDRELNELTWLLAAEGSTATREVDG